MRHRLPAVAGFAVAVAPFALLAAGCGGGGSAAVANVASPATTAATVTTAPAQSGPVGGASAQGGAIGGRRGGVRQMAIDLGNATQGAKFSACIRGHGITSFPDPNSQGMIQGAEIDPNAPTFRSALRACEKLLPNGSLAPTSAEEAQRQQQMLVFSKCMRAHGIGDFPDPTNGGQLQLNGGPGSDLDPNNPQFQRARTACEGQLPPGGQKELPGR